MRANGTGAGRAKLSLAGAGALRLECRMRSLRESLRLVVLLVVLLACNRGGCGRAEHRVAIGTLPADPIEAARELGKAAVNEHDAKKLAGKLGAFLERIQVPVVRLDGQELLVRGYLDFPPKELFLWEPVVAGVARATAKGDVRRFSLIARTLFPKATLEDIDQLDIVRMMSEAAKDVVAKKGSTTDAMLVVAIATDLETRAGTSVTPWIDPTCALLFGLWAALSNEKAGPAPLTEPGALPPGASGMPALPPGVPGLPPGFKLPKQPNALTQGEPPAASCAFMEKAAKAGKALGAAAKWGGKIGGWLSDNPIFGKLGGMTKAATLAQTVTEGIAGMGIAAFVEVDGDVKPTKVRYGDGPVTYTVRVESLNPFDKSQLDSFINCLESMNPSAAVALEPLRDLPPKGGMANVPVYWDGASALDPKHGKFSPDNASVPDGLVQQLVKAGMQVAGGSVTDSSGKATAKFQVKPKGQGKTQGLTHVESFTVSAVVFPFPAKPSLVYAGSNVVANRAVPLRLEVEVPLPKDWIFGLKESALATGEGIAGGWTINLEASVPFSLGENLDFSAEGPGSWSFGFDGSAGGGVIQCRAPVGKYPFSLSVSGKVTNVDGMAAHFNLKDSSNAQIKGKLTCTGLGGISMSAPLQGPASGSMTSGTPLQSFDMPLTDGATKTFPITQGSAKGSAKVTLTAKSE